GFNTRSTKMSTETHTFSIETNQNNSALNYSDANEHDSCQQQFNQIQP
ncbi:hypothetical protein BpHYR1_010372, partial [Brachionus plicatilis]